MRTNHADPWDLFWFWMHDRELGIQKEVVVQDERFKLACIRKDGRVEVSIGNS
jgi:hypothetical protein